MGMDVLIEIVDSDVSPGVFDQAFDCLREVDARFSTYKPDSEISKINRGEISEDIWSGEMKEVFDLSELTRVETNNFFNIKNQAGEYDPSGLVKGWSIHKAADILRGRGVKNFMVDIGSDIEVSGQNSDGEPWAIGIRNPFKVDEVVKVVYLSDMGIATSGKYAKGEHIYNPNNFSDNLDEVSSVTVIACDVYEADRFATAVFAMGREGINFLEERDGLEGYIIDRYGVATMTSGFEQFVK
jgi:thiamine biosynthesis lipoprotein